MACGHCIGVVPGTDPGIRASLRYDLEITNNPYFNPGQALNPPDKAVDANDAQSTSKLTRVTQSRYLV